MPQPALQLFPNVVICIKFHYLIAENIDYTEMLQHKSIITLQILYPYLIRWKKHSSVFRNAYLPRIGRLIF